ncbi:hypothetical protein EAG_07081 [Camponotus floridanus]|uniref:Uncharacterized protein n=1 Tax=Camponotus floridanus TaxID=104421 RepID=E2AJQ3_CAMFO|nr:hypothetical protein EAG_07081 [Camponotus floridanus]
MLMRVQAWVHTGNREAGGRGYAGGWLRKKLEAAIFAVLGRSYAIRQGKRNNIKRVADAVAKSYCGRTRGIEEREKLISSCVAEKKVQRKWRRLQRPDFRPCVRLRVYLKRITVNNVDRLVVWFYLQYRPSNAIKLNRRKFSRRSWPGAKIRCQCCRQRHFAVPLGHSVKAELELALWGLIPMLMAVVGSKPGHGNPVAGLESAIMQSHPDPGRLYHSQALLIGRHRRVIDVLYALRETRPGLYRRRRIAEALGPRFLLMAYYQLLEFRATYFYELNIHTGKGTISNNSKWSDPTRQLLTADDVLGSGLATR